LTARTKHHQIFYHTPSLASAPSSPCYSNTLLPHPHLPHNPHHHPPHSKKFTQKFSVLKFIFWFNNLSYLLFAILSLFSLFSASNRTDLIEFTTNSNPFQLLLTFILLSAPILAILIVLGSKKLKIVTPISRVFFLFEVPLITLSFIALFTFPNTIPFVYLLILGFILAPLLLFLQPLLQHTTSTTLSIALYLCQLFTFTTASYVSILLSFFLPGVAIVLASQSLDFFMNSISNSFGLEMIFMILPLVFYFLIFTILSAIWLALILSPYIISFLTFRSIRTSIQTLTQRISKSNVQILTTSYALVIVLITIFITFQTSNPLLLDKLYSIQALQSFEERAQVANELIPLQSQLQASLQDALRSSSRYPLRADNQVIYNLYQEAFGNTNSDQAAQILQSSYNLLAYPLIYHPLPQADKAYLNTLKDNYEYLFAIQVNAFPRSNSTTLNPVRLQERTATGSPILNNRFAKITIQESFANTRSTNQEVLYEFYLPPHSVITDLKLGDQLQYPGQIAPRAAAERVYTQELNRQRDPALLEQTGPQQYRLRVFPIPPQSNNSTPLQVSYTYLTPLTTQGYALPQFTKQQNIQNPKEFQLTWQNNLVGLVADYYDETTLSTYCQAYPTPRTFSSAPLSLIDQSCTPTVTKATLPSSLTIILDTSSSNSNLQNDWAQLQDILQDYQPQPSRNISIYLANDLLSRPYSIDQILKLPAPKAFGNPPSSETFSNTFSGSDNLILISSDPNIQTLQTLTPKFQKSVIVSTQPPAMIQKDAITAYQASSQFTNTLTGALHLFSKDDLFQIIPNSTPVGPPVADPHVNAIATHLDIANSISRYPNPNLPIQTIDRLHTQAQQANIVTVYSSLIALVNTSQQQNLLYESEKWDRYETTSPSSSNLTIPTDQSFGFSNTPSVPLFGNFVGSSQDGRNITISDPNSSNDTHTQSSSSLGNPIIFIFIALNCLLAGAYTLYYLFKKFFRHRPKKQ
jgi:hypothetical protein